LALAANLRRCMMVACKTECRIWAGWVLYLRLKILNESGNRPFIVMELLQGQSLDQPKC
jgi:hypothetical protein